MQLKQEVRTISKGKTAMAGGQCHDGLLIKRIKNKGRLVRISGPAGDVPASGAAAKRGTAAYVQ